VRRQLQRHLFPGEEADDVHAEALGDVRQDSTAVLHLDLEQRIGQGFLDRGLDANRRF
jgi:hypothetical protein